jgi:hypothetical protein
MIIKLYVTKAGFSMDYGELHGHYVYRFLGSVKFFSFICLSPFPCAGNPWRA